MIDTFPYSKGKVRVVVVFFNICRTGFRGKNSGNWQSKIEERIWRGGQPEESIENVWQSEDTKCATMLQILSDIYSQSYLVNSNHWIVKQGLRPVWKSQQNVL